MYSVRYWSEDDEEFISWELWETEASAFTAAVDLSGDQPIAVYNQDEALIAMAYAGTLCIRKRGGITMSNLQEADNHWIKCECGGWIHWGENFEVSTHRADFSFNREVFAMVDGRAEADSIAELHRENVLWGDATDERHKVYLRRVLEVLENSEMYGENR